MFFEGRNGVRAQKPDEPPIKFWAEEEAAHNGRRKVTTDADAVVACRSTSVACSPQFWGLTKNNLVFCMVPRTNFFCSYHLTVTKRPRGKHLWGRLCPGTCGIHWRRGRGAAPLGRRFRPMPLKKRTAAGRSSFWPRAARRFRNAGLPACLVKSLMNHVADDVPTAPEQNGGAADP